MEKNIPGTGDLAERISTQYYNLTAAEKRIGDYITAHEALAQTMSISELAEAGGVAEATVTRFSKRLGYKGFSELRLAIAMSVSSSGTGLSPLSGEVYETDDFSELSRKLYGVDTDALTQTLELLDEAAVNAAADILEAAERVYCMGQGGSLVIAEEAAHLFTTVRSKYFTLHDSHTQVIAASTMGPQDAVLYFSYSGSTRDIMQTLDIVRARGARSILITKYPESPGAKKADVVLRCGARESPLQLGSVAAKLSQLFLLDVLFSVLCRRHLEDCRESRTRIAAALTEKHL